VQTTGSGFGTVKSIRGKVATVEVDGGSGAKKRFIKQRTEELQRIPPEE